METPIKATIRSICLDAHTEQIPSEPKNYMVEIVVSEKDARKIRVGKNGE